MEHSTDGSANTEPVRRGSEVQATRCREGETGHNVFVEGNMEGAPIPETISPELHGIAEQAVRYPEMVFNNISHKVDLAMLRKAYHQTRKDGAVGIDEVTADEYAENLEENLKSLHSRLKSGTYKAPPVERVWIDKDDRKKRPIGIPTFEDKIAQRANATVMSAIYEVDFYDFSYGFRKGYSQHQALHTLRESCMEKNIKWIVDADVSGYFDSIDHDILRSLIQRRISDKGIIRMIGKWLNAGVMEEGKLKYPEKGTPQGGVISPLLSNIYLHYVLDEWFVKEVKPRMKGRCIIIRFADDFIIGFEYESDARRFMEVLPKRFNRFGLTIHLEKTKMVEFRKPEIREKKANGNGTFTFLGFTHYWAKSRRGYWVIKRKTAKKRLNRFLKRLWIWIRVHRHAHLKEQCRELSIKLRGHYQYYGVRCNYESLEKVYYYAIKSWKYWLSRRSHKGNINWEKFIDSIEEKLPLPRPRICHNI